MKKTLSIKLITLAVCASSISFADAGLLFKITPSGGTLPSTPISLCLNGKGPLSCQNYTVSNTNLCINTTIPNHVYPIAGIKLNNSGVKITNGCTPIGNGYCLFSASDKQCASITLASTSGRPVLAVGAYLNNANENPLSYYSSNSGQNWVVSLPTLQGSGKSGLSGVTCDTTGQICTAVGKYTNGKTGKKNPLSYYTTDGGKTWSNPVLPPTHGNGDSELIGTACDSTGQTCTAVGYYKPNNVKAPLTYFSNNGGKSWTVSTTLPRSVLGSTDNELKGVTCDSIGQRCIAVGNYFIIFGNRSPLTYYSSDGGKTWSNPVLPTTVGNGDSQLFGVACDSTGKTCTATGFYTKNSSNKENPITYFSSDGGKDWMPSLPPPQGSGDGDSELVDTACDSTGQICTAVGYYTNGTKAPLSYLSSDGGKTWITSLPPFQGSADSELGGVTCDSTAQICTAVGFYNRTGSNSGTPLSYYSNNGGKKWTVSFPQPQGSDGVLFGVA